MIKRHIACRLGSPQAFLFLLLVAAFPSFANELVARELLAKQSLAMSSLDYRGILTYEHGAHLATMEITHRVIDGLEHERLVHLNGNHRAVARDRDLAQCPHQGERLLRGLDAKGAGSDIDALYHISVVGEERIAGRLAVMVQVMPRDQHRYGYVIGIDKASYLALKIILIGPGARVLERFQFADLEILEPQQRSEIQAQSQANCDPAIDRIARWEAHWLPPGFKLAGSRELPGEREMLMYTDGLAAFSIFIDRVDAPAILEGRAQRGATVAYMGRAEGGSENFRVTVVGEVPSPSLERVALSLRQAAGAAP